MRVVLLSCVASSLLLAGCGAGSAGDPDGGIAAGDAGPAAPDGGAPFDGGSTVADAGGSDAGPVDAGDAVDAGETPDAGWEADGGDAPDAGPGSREERPWNGGFERWDGLLPDAWSGLQSNLPDTSIEKVTDAPFEGLNAARLVNESGTHRRFTTAPVSARAGRYTCVYRVRGHGEIRTARYDTDFSSYTPSGYHAIDTDDWQEFSYAFTLAADVADTFELVFSIRNTQSDRGHLVLDGVECERTPEPCDTVQCESWAACSNDTATCLARPGRCADDAGCAGWETCNDTHRCEPRPGRCNTTPECAAATPATPVCEAHTCVAGDPCAGVTCTSPRTCRPDSGLCGLSPGTCVTTADCTGTAPACDTATSTCVGADHPANVFPNGGFEAWDTYVVPYLGTHDLPDHWYGLDIPGSSEIHPSQATRDTTHVHSGTSAIRFVQPGVAERFTSEAFDLPTGRYSCSYRVRGHGTIRHRHYSTGGWSPYTDFLEVDSEAWVRVPFAVDGNVRDFRLILYPSFTHADRDHLQVDDVVCTRNP